MKSNKKKKINRHDVQMGVRPNRIESNINKPNQLKYSQSPLSATVAPQIRRKGPIATSTKQIAGYFTVAGIENEISIPEKDWPVFTLKELSDNPADFLNDYYRYSRTRYIAIRIRIDKLANDSNLTRIFRIAVRNTNVDQIEVFGGGLEGLQQIFDYQQWYSTKRNQHRMTAGSLGDYLKRHAGMAYASWNNMAHSSSDNDNDDIDVQWEEPIIFRFNGSEYRVFVYYDRYRGQPDPVIKYAGQSDAIDYTEVECALPVSRINCSGDGSNQPLFDRLYQYYRIYKIAKPDIKFSLDMRYDIHHITEQEESA
jgi:hypothetical protein